MKLEKQGCSEKMVFEKAIDADSDEVIDELMKKKQQLMALENELEHMHPCASIARSMSKIVSI